MIRLERFVKCEMPKGEFTLPKLKINTDSDPSLVSPPQRSADQSLGLFSAQKKSDAALPCPFAPSNHLRLPPVHPHPWPVLSPRNSGDSAALITPQSLSQTPTFRHFPPIFLTGSIRFPSHCRTSPGLRTSRQFKTDLDTLLR